MWKLLIVYDKGKTTITGKHDDIPLSLAEKYYNEYIKNRDCTATYQQYPKNRHMPEKFMDKLEKLRLTDWMTNGPRKGGAKSDV